AVLGGGAVPVAATAAAAAPAAASAAASASATAAAPAAASATAAAPTAASAPAAASATAAGSATAPSVDVAGRVLAAVADVSAFPADALRKDQRLASDLGFDSLMFVELGTKVEAAFPGFDGGIPQSLLSETTTIGDLIEHLETELG